MGWLHDPAKVKLYSPMEDTNVPTITFLLLKNRRLLLSPDKVLLILIKKPVRMVWIENSF